MSSSVDSSSRVEPSSSQHPLADAQHVADTLHEPLLVVGNDLRVKQVDPAFCEAFATNREATIGESVSELAGDSSTSSRFGTY